MTSRVAAGLLPCCWCLLVNADTLPCFVLSAAAAWPPRALVIAPRDIRAPCFPPLACWALMAGCYLRVAALWCRGPIGPRLSAPVGQVLPWAPHSVCCTSWHTLQTTSTGGTLLKALPVLPPVPVQPLGPRAMAHLFHTCWLDASRYYSRLRPAYVSFVQSAKLRTTAAL